MKTQLDPATRERVRNLLEAARSCWGGPTARATAIQLRRGAMRIARASRVRAAVREIDRGTPDDEHIEALEKGNRPVVE